MAIRTSEEDNIYKDLSQDGVILSHSSSTLKFDYFSLHGKQWFGSETRGKSSEVASTLKLNGTLSFCIKLMLGDSRASVIHHGF